MMELQTLEMQQTPKKRMNRKPQPTNEEGNETNPFIGLWLRHCLAPDVAVPSQGDRGTRSGDL